MWRMLAVGCAVCLLVNGSARPDAIVADGEAYEDVYVKGTDGAYEVYLPQDGVMKRFRTDQVEPGSVVIDSDPAKRRERLTQWSANFVQREGPVPPPPRRTEESSSDEPGHAAVSENTARAATRSTAMAMPRSSGHAETLSDGIVRPFSARGMTAREALKATLRPLGLDFRVVNGNHIWISTPRRLRYEALEDMESRTYDLKSLGTDSLPKVVLNQPGGVGEGNASLPDLMRPAGGDVPTVIYGH